MEYENDREAEDALTELKGKDLEGQTLNIGKYPSFMLFRMEQKVF